MKNIILLSIDNLRYDGLTFDGGHEFANTPLLDKFLSKNTVWCKRTLTTCPVTPPAHASMLTGMNPPDHNVYCFNTPLPSNIGTLGSIFLSMGHDTLASVEHFSLKQLDICKDFNHVDVPEDGDHAVKDYINDYQNQKPCFMFIHHLDVHKPYYYLTGDVDDQLNNDYPEMIEGICKKYNIDFEEILKDALVESKRIMDGDDISTKLRLHSDARSLHYLLNIEMNKRSQFSRQDWEKVITTLYYAGVTKYVEKKLIPFIELLKKKDILNEESLLVLTSDHGEDVYRYNGLWEFMHGSGVRLTKDLCHVPMAFISDTLENETVNNITSITNILPFIRAWYMGNNPMLSLKAQDVVKTWNVDYSMHSMRFKRDVSHLGIDVTGIKTWKENDFNGRSGNRNTDS